MATTPTNKPIPSEDPRDLKFNAGKIDEVVTSDAHYYTDRFGVRRWTIAGFQYTAEEAIRNYGYITMDSFEDGATLTLPNQVLRYKANGEYYRWDGEFPKIVTEGSTPESSGGVGLGAWVSVGDASLRTELSYKYGFSLVGAASYNDIRNYTGSKTRILCYGRTNQLDGGYGIFVLDDTDTTSDDNDGAILVTTDGKRWKREFAGRFQAAWFGAIGDGVTNSTDAINKLLSAAGTYSKIEFSKGTYLTAGLHNILEGQDIKFNDATFKSDGTADTHELFFINTDNVSLHGGFTIDGESRNPGERHPKVAIGLRVGNTRTVNNFSCSGFRGLGTVYALYITSAKNSRISDCYAYRNGDGFRIASNTTAVLDVNGVDNLVFERCVAEENGYPYLPTDGTMFTTSSGGFKVTDVAIRNLKYIDCVAINNCAHGFDYHGHDYTSVPSGFLQDGLHYINCQSISNNTPEAYRPASEVAPQGLSSGFFLAAGGTPIYNVTIDGCSSYGHVGEEIFVTSLDNVNGIVGLTVKSLSVFGAARASNTGIRATNSVIRTKRVRNLCIKDITLRNVGSLYNFVVYNQDTRGITELSGFVEGDAPNLLYTQASTDSTAKLILSDFTHRKVDNLDSTAAVSVRALDYTEILVDGITISDVAATKPLVQGIFQQKPNRDTISLKVVNSVFTGSSSKMTAAVEISTLGGSKLISGNTVSNATYGFIGGGTENAIIAANHMVTGTVTTPLLNFPGSTIKIGNYGIS